MKSFLAFVLCLVCLGVANAQLKAPAESVMDRFLRYVKIDTQSQEDQTTTPSTRKQLNLGGSNFHGKLEFNSRRGLEKSTETLVNLVQIFAEKS